MCAQVRHATLTGSDLHEPKGVAGATTGHIAVADGGTISWTGDIAPDSVVLADEVWEDLPVVINVQSGGGSNPPAFTKLLDDGSSSTGIYCYHFEAAAEKELFFYTHLPHSYKEGTDVKFHVHWAPTTTNTGNVVWGVEYSVANTNVALPNSTLVTATVAADGVAKAHQVDAVATITGTTLKVGTVIVGRFYRKAADAGDTFTGVAAALTIDLHYQKDKFGTSAEYPA